jgi:hypothetical protein
VYPRHQFRFRPRSEHMVMLSNRRMYDSDDEVREAWRWERAL